MPTIISDEPVLQANWDGVCIGRVQIVAFQGRKFKIRFWYENAKLLKLDCIDL